tara:strand:- start:55 stop:282 length:228 start_codon:yes stop_codon:yes gene_type:complete
MLKVSKIFENKKLLESVAFNSLSPKMKSAVSTMIDMVDEDKNILDEFENAMNVVAKKHDVKKEDIETYIDKELGL